MKTSLVALALAVSFATSVAAQTAVYRQYVPGYPAQRENSSFETQRIDLGLCQTRYARGDFIMFHFETDALTKEKRLGQSSLDAHDMNYIVGAENRRKACLGLLADCGKLTLKDRALDLVGKLR